MKTIFTLACALSLSVQAEVITNGGFESGLSGWTKADQIGSDGTFSVQSGTQSPVNLFTVPAPPEGTAAAMTDGLGPGTHVLYQDFVVPTFMFGAVLRFSLFVNNDNGAPDFFAPTPAHLDFSTPDLNQQARVDILTTTANPFSVDPADVLLNLYQTQPGDPLRSGYNDFMIGIAPLLQAHQGETLRLRFAEADNVAPFNLGVDDVRISDIPEPSTWMMMLGGLLGVGLVRRQRVTF